MSALDEIFGHGIDIHVKNFEQIKAARAELAALRADLQAAQQRIAALETETQQQNLTVVRLETDLKNERWINENLQRAVNEARPFMEYLSIYGTRDEAKEAIDAWLAAHPAATLAQNGRDEQREYDDAQQWRKDQAEDFSRRVDAA